MSTILIGIAGGTGSGKTTLTRHLKEHFGPEVTVIGHDMTITISVRTARLWKNGPR